MGTTQFLPFLRWAQGRGRLAFPFRPCGRGSPWLQKHLEACSVQKIVIIILISCECLLSCLSAASQRHGATLKSRPSKLSLYITHRSSLVNYATPIVGCRARAEDVVQDAYLRFDAMKTRQQAAAEDAITHPVAYLYRIVRNLSLNCVRRQASEGVSAGTGVLESLSTTAPTPEREVQCREELLLVAQALAGLPERTRRAFELYRLGGHTLQQVASILGISVGLTHQLVSDAMTCCADRLGGRD